ncbi:MAG: iron ABC transporter permease [Lentisphaeria bacterium]|nr:iron ABC transporter permease [Lentisphaeria bacterium]
MKQKTVACLITIACAALFLPPCLTLLGAFWHYGPSLYYFNAVFDNSTRFFELARNSFVVCLVALSISMIPGIGLSFLIFRFDFFLKKIVLVCIAMFSFIPLYITTTSWTALVGNELWYRMDAWYYKAFLAGLVLGISFLPFVILVFSVAFAKRSAMADAALLNTGQFNTLIKVLIPENRFLILGLSLILIVFTLTDISVTDTMRLRTFAEESYIQFALPDTSLDNDSAHKIKRASAVSVPVFICIIALFSLLIKNFSRIHVCQFNYQNQEPTQLKGSKNIWLSLVLAAVLLLWLVPYSALLEAVVSWQNLQNSFGASQREIFYTISFALVAATFTTLLLSISTYFAYRHCKYLLIPGLAIIAIPGPLLGLSLVEFFNNETLGVIYDSPLILILNWFYRSAPYVIIIYLCIYNAIPKQFMEDARLEGIGFFREWWMAVLAYKWQGMIIAFLLSFLFSIGELGGTVLICPPGYSTITVRFATMVHNGIYSDAAGLCLIIIHFVMLPMALIVFAFWKILSKKL